MLKRSKLVASVIALVLCVCALTACSNTNNNNENTDVNEQVSTEAVENTPEISEEAEENKSETTVEEVKPVVISAGYNPEKIAIHDIVEMPSQEELDANMATNAKKFTHEEFATIEDPTDGGLYRIMFPKAVEVDERASGWETNPDRVIAIHYDYQNISVEKDDFYVCYCWFKVLDEKGNELTLYPLQRDKADRIKVGQQGYGLNGWELYNDSEKVFIEYYANGHFEGKPLAKFEIPITQLETDENVDTEVAESTEAVINEEAPKNN